MFLLCQFQNSPPHHPNNSSHPPTTACSHKLHTCKQREVNCPSLTTSEGEKDVGKLVAYKAGLPGQEGPVLAEA